MVKITLDRAFYWVLRFAVMVAAGVVVVAIVYPSPIMRGAPGPAGPAGADGVGEKGDTGKRGPAGADGEIGRTGGKGKTGDTGATGKGFWK